MSEHRTDATSERQTVPCGLCGTPTPMTGTKRCDHCWELEGRIHRNPKLAAQILAAMPSEIAMRDACHDAAEQQQGCFRAMRAERLLRESRPGLPIEEFEAYLRGEPAPLSASACRECLAWGAAVFKACGNRHVSKPDEVDDAVMAHVKHHIDGVDKAYAARSSTAQPTLDEMRDAFIALGYWPNEVMWKVWEQACAWRAGFALPSAIATPELCQQAEAWRTLLWRWGSGTVTLDTAEDGNFRLQVEHAEAADECYVAATPEAVIDAALKAEAHEEDRGT